jgi:Mus7/MMS22 family
MANWKEKGVVPDSDDEDALDSQSTAADHETYNEKRQNHAHIIENDLETRDIEEEVEGEVLEPDDLENSISATLPALDELLEQSVTTPLPALELKNSSNAVVNGHNRVPSSSPNSPKVFKVPKVFWEVEEDFSGRAERSIPTPGSGTSANDEISRSYVQIASSTSSILTSLPVSQVILPPNAPLSRKESILLQMGTQAAILSANATEENFEIPDTMTYGRRSLRQRNPIQLHPYIVEQEKYRQTLKARGIAPMRLALSQGESHCRSRRTASPEIDSQERDSQDATETGDSQPMDFDWDPSLSSSPLMPNENDAAATMEDNEHPERDNEEDDDDEFPDIEELLSTQLLLPQPNGHRRQIKSYSTKPKGQALPKAQNKRKGSLVPRGHSSNAFSILASPPQTSSPFPPTSHGSASSKTYSASRFLNDSAQIISSQVNISTEKLADLPTPATSAAKAIPVLIDSDSEGELASEQGATSSDELIQIRRVSKKIRGVLPASHLRLDHQQKKPQASSRSHRDTFSVSPIRTEPRRGVALPRAFGLLQSSSALTKPGFDFLSSDSDKDDEENRGSDFIFEENPPSPLDSLYSQSRLGFAEEDDRIDAMLPARKRQSSSSKIRERKRSRVGSSTLFPTTNNPYSIQPKITEHLYRPQRSDYRSKGPKRANKPVLALARQNNDISSLPRKPPPPRLSILDVVDFHRKTARDAPRFIKIAARTARSKSGQGRQSPSRKFIRLANRKDTHDAQSVLEDWREGRIVPMAPERFGGPSDQISIHPLKEIENNRQTTFQPPVLKSKQHPQISNARGVGIRRKLVITRGRQQSMNVFVTKDQGSTQDPKIFPRREHAKSKRWQKGNPRYVPPAARFAQLESSEILNSLQNSASAFKSTKKTLDALYRISRKRLVPRANLQLSRFLADEDVVHPSVEVRNRVGDAIPELGVISQNSRIIESNRQRRKKRPPQRLDAGAAVYRQPSDPLILESLTPATELDIGVVEGCKLLGLAKFGTPYPLHFDVFPLQPGVFFHENTFIGSGRLSKALRRTGNIHRRSVRSQTSFMLIGKTFSWCQWNEDVSSEIGLCFDWLVDQLTCQSPPPSSPSTTDASGITNSLLEYVHHHLSFDGADDVKNFLCRMIEIFQDAFSRLESGRDDFNHSESRVWIEVNSMFMLILLELLRIARTRNEEPLAYQLEDLTKKFAMLCIKVLLSQNLDRLRKLYDDLQYLSFRDGGIKSDEYLIQGWVIVMKILEAARIPRGSFWDVVNPQIVTADIKNVSDARVIEKLWYSMFSLLPLSDFDEFGVVIEGRRQTVLFDNWSLPQQLLKRVFSLYHANQRQSPGFNDYCRGIVGRCHYLMVEWGWWNCSGVIGTLFDFFGSHNLAHLRNEEAYASPHFLQELDGEPKLMLEAEDRCFHIFLKIVALAIRHFDNIGDSKSIRNLVARLLPNHNRQYPKEESIHQRDLASLRNHHDLLCTLYWAAPSQHRPQPTLIQELVIADISHKEACLINLRAWEQLTNFVLTHDTDQETYQPLKLWFQDFFSKLVQQCTRVEDEIRGQARAIQGTNKQALQEKQLQEIILANRETIKVTLCTFVKAIACQIKRVVCRPKDWMNLLETCQSRRLIKCPRTDSCVVPLEQAVALLKIDTHSRSSHALLHACVDVFNSCIDQVTRGAVLTQDEHHVTSMTDEAVDFLEKSLLIPFRVLVNDYLDAMLPLSLHNGSIYFANELYEELIACWARFVALVTDKYEGNGCSDVSIA